MKLDQFASNLTSQAPYIRASFGGFQGAGKTRTATEFIVGAYKQLKCTKPILIIDNEKGARFLIPIFEKHGIKAIAKNTTSLSDVLTAFEYLENNDINFLFIDSLTKIYYRYVKDYKEKNKKSFMTLQDWGKILPAWQEQFSDRLSDLERNVVFTGRGGFEYDKEDDEVDDQGKVIQKGSFVKSGFKMKIAGETPFETDLNVWMQMEQDIKHNKPKHVNVAYILKDRSDTINGKSFEMPKYRNFRPFVNFLLGLPAGEIAGESTHENLTPGDDRDYFQFKLNQKIEIEKIESIFDLYGLGSPRSADDKKLKTIIIQKIFGTTSKTEIEKMKPEQLNYCRQQLEELFNEIKNEQPENVFEFINNGNGVAV